MQNIYINIDVVKSLSQQSLNQNYLDTCGADSSSELRSISKISSFCPVPDTVVVVAATELPEDTGGVSSSLRGSPLCFFLRLFFFFVAVALGAGGSGGSSGSRGSLSFGSLDARFSTSEIQNR